MYKIKYILNIMIIGQPSAAELAERISIEGKVIQRAECRPVADKSYLTLKRQAVHKYNNM